MVHGFEKAAMSRFLFFCPYSMASCICSGVSFERTACAGLKTNKHKIKQKILVCKNNFLVTDSFPSIIAKLFLQAFFEQQYCNYSALDSAGASSVCAASSVAAVGSVDSAGLASSVA